MKPICALRANGFATNHDEWLGGSATKCAERAGLMPKSWRNSRLKFIKPAKLEDNGQGDLFADIKESND
jgi:hypothetical protein